MKWHQKLAGTRQDEKTGSRQEIRQIVDSIKVRH